MDYQPGPAASIKSRWTFEAYFFPSGLVTSQPPSGYGFNRKVACACPVKRASKASSSLVAKSRCCFRLGAVKKGIQEQALQEERRSSSSEIYFSFTASRRARPGRSSPIVGVLHCCNSGSKLGWLQLFGTAALRNLKNIFPHSSAEDQVALLKAPLSSGETVRSRGRIFQGYRTAKNVTAAGAALRGSLL